MRVLLHSHRGTRGWSAPGQVEGLPRGCCPQARQGSGRQRVKQGQNKGHPGCHGPVWAWEGVVIASISKAVTPPSSSSLPSSPPCSTSCMPSVSITTEEAGGQATWKMLFQNQECQLPKLVFNRHHLDGKQLTNDDITASTDHLFRLSDEIMRWQMFGHFNSL